MDRPEMGQQVEIVAKVIQQKFYAERDKYGRTPKRWVRSEIKPCMGMYIGYRTKSDGLVWWESDEVGVVFVPTDQREVWLVVPGPRCNPIPVLPDDARIK